MGVSKRDLRNRNLMARPHRMCPGQVRRELRQGFALPSVGNHLSATGLPTTPEIGPLSTLEPSVELTRTVAEVRTIAGVRRFFRSFAESISNHASFYGKKGVGGQLKISEGWVNGNA